MALSDNKITSDKLTGKQVTDAPDQPQGTAQQNKYLFDRLAQEVLIPAINSLIDGLTGAGASDIGVSVPGVTGTTVEDVLTSMKTLIDDRYTKAQSDAKLTNKTAPLIKSVQLDPQTGIWTFIKENGQTVTVDTNLEKIALDAEIDSDTKEFVLTLADGTEQRVSLADFVRFLEFADSDTIAFTVEGGTVTAEIQAGSVTEDMLDTALLAQVENGAETAETAAENAGQYAGQAQGYATDADASAADAAISAHNAAVWNQGGRLMEEAGTLQPGQTTGAKQYAEQAAASAGNAAAYASAADTSKNAAAESAEDAEYWAGQAQQAAGGGVTSFNGRAGFVEPQAGDYTAEMVGARPDTWTPTAADTGAIPASQKGQASGVASLDTSGKVPAGQLPAMDYDLAGSAQAVQESLNTHAADTTKHVTAAERQTWNGKANASHTHAASNITSGTLPISRGGTGVSSMTGTDYTTSRPRGIALQSSVPSSIPNGCIVGVYET